MGSQRGKTTVLSLYEQRFFPYDDAIPIELYHPL